MFRNMRYNFEMYNYGMYNYRMSPHMVKQMA